MADGGAFPINKQVSQEKRSRIATALILLFGVLPGFYPGLFALGILYTLILGILKGGGSGAALFFVMVTFSALCGWVSLLLAAFRPLSKKIILGLMLGLISGAVGFYFLSEGLFYKNPRTIWKTLIAPPSLFSFCLLSMMITALSLLILYYIKDWRIKTRSSNTNCLYGGD